MIKQFSTYNNNDYLVIVNDALIRVYCNIESAPFFSRTTDNNNISSAVYFSNSFYFSNKKDNTLYCYKNQESEKEIIYEFDKFEEIKIIKSFSNGEDGEVLISGNSKSGNNKCFIFSLLKNKLVSFVPMSNGLKDIEYNSKGDIVQLINHNIEPSGYIDDEEKIFKVIVYNFNKLKENNEKKLEINDADLTEELLGYISIFTDEDFYCRTYSEEISKHMHYPLFDNFMYNWPIELSISNDGNCIIYYCEDISGLIVANIDGTIKNYFYIEKGYTKDSLYYYNNDNNILYVCDNNSFSAFHLFQNDEIRDKLNKEYENAINESENLQYSFEFKKLLYEFLISVDNKEINRIDKYLE